MKLPLEFLLERIGIDCGNASVSGGAHVNAVYLLDGLAPGADAADRLSATSHDTSPFAPTDQLPIEDNALYIGSQDAFDDLVTSGEAIPDNAFFLVSSRSTRNSASRKARSNGTRVRLRGDGAVSASKAPTQHLDERVVHAGPFDLPRTVNSAIGVVFRFRNWADRFQTLLQSPENADALMRECSALFGNAAYLVDSSFKVIAIDDSPLFCEISYIWKHLVDEGYLLYDIVYSMHASREIDDMHAQGTATLCEAPQFNNPFINYNLKSRRAIADRQGGNEELLGHFFVVGYQKRITRGELALANQVGEQLACFVERFGLSQAKQSLHATFLRRLVEGTLTDAPTIVRQIAPWGWKADHRLYAVAIREQSGPESLRGILAEQLEYECGLRSVQSEDCILGLVSAGSPDAPHDDTVFSQLGQFLERKGCVAGISDGFAAGKCKGAYFQQAASALTCALRDRAPAAGTSALAANSPTPPIRRFGECFAPCIAFHMAQTDSLDKFVDDRICALIAFDERHGTDYALTLKTYLLNERHLNETAAKLYIHRNTLLYRVGRLKEAFGFELDDPGQRMRLLFSLEAINYEE